VIEACQAIGGRASRALRRHPYHAGLAAVSGGLAVSPGSRWLGTALAALAALGCATLEAPRLGLAAAGLVLVGAAAGGWRLAAIERPARGLRDGTSVTATTILLERPRPSAHGSSAVLKIVSGAARATRLLARSPHKRWPAGGEPGVELQVQGSFERARPPPSGEFDIAAYLRRRGVAGELAVDEMRATGRRRGGIAGAIDAMRRRAEAAISAGLRPGEGALARGMVLGEDEAIERTTRDDFRASGLGHLLAVSGQNVMLLAALALPLLALAGLGPHARLAVLLGLIALYVPLAGAGPSLQRAGVMGAAGVVALAAGRPVSRWYALLLAATATLALNPRVSGDPGWQLSFAAVAGIICLAAPVRRAIGSLPHAVADGVALTVAATVATAPLMAFHFGAVPVAGLAANLAALPAVAPVMWIGMLQTALGQLAVAVEPVAGGAQIAARTLGAINAPLLDYLAAVARHFAELPGGQLALPLRSPPTVALAYVTLGAVALAIARAGRGLAAFRGVAGSTWRRIPPAGRVTVVAAALAAGALVAWRIAAVPPAPQRLTVSFLDVGQGDATLVQDPRGGTALFDGGRAEARVARLLRRLGVRRVDVVVATHASADHHGGLREVLERFPVGLLLDGGDGTRDPGFRTVRSEAAHRGVRTVPALAGETLRVGTLAIRILSPPPRPGGPPPEDPNPRGVAAVVSSGGFDLFLAADAESDALAPLALPDVDAMKVSHHGSADPGLPELLRRLRPEVAAIEVGAHNPYGHPAQSTLSALREAVPHVYRTDRDGTVRVAVEKRGVSVSSER
jgi:competence protein ComEC